MRDVLMRAAVFAGQALCVWTILACLAAAVIGGYLRNKARDERRREEALARSYDWARQHGGDPEYGGNLRGRVA